MNNLSNIFKRDFRNSYAVREPNGEKPVKLKSAKIIYLKIADEKPSRLKRVNNLYLS